MGTFNGQLLGSQWYMFHTYFAQQKISHCLVTVLSKLGNSVIIAVGIRPVQNASTTVRVNYGLALIEILDFDRDTRRIHVKIWERFVSDT